MTAEAKLRSLASADTTLQGLFGTAPFRWFDTRPPLNQAYPNVAVLRVSTAIDYDHDRGRVLIDQPRFQLDVRDLDPETARSAAKAILAFLDTLNLAVAGGAVGGRQS